METARNGHFGNPKFSWEQPKQLKIRRAFAEKLSLAAKPKVPLIGISS